MSIISTIVRDLIGDAPPCPHGWEACDCVDSAPTSAPHPFEIAELISTARALTLMSRTESHDSVPERRHTVRDAVPAIWGPPPLSDAAHEPPQLPQYVSALYGLPDRVRECAVDCSCRGTS